MTFIQFNCLLHGDQQVSAETVHVAVGSTVRIWAWCEGCDGITMREHDQWFREKLPALRRSGAVIHETPILVDTKDLEMVETVEDIGWA